MIKPPFTLSQKSPMQLLNEVCDMRMYILWCEVLFLHLDEHGQLNRSLSMAVLWQRMEEWTNYFSWCMS